MQSGFCNILSQESCEIAPPGIIVIYKVRAIADICEMKIPPEKLDEISSANDIVEVISDYIPVKKRGKSFLALCPFHPDKNPSLHISQEKQVYHCFSCKAGGNVYSFVQNYEKIGFIDAATKLAERAGIRLTFSGKELDTSNEISVLLEINKAAAEYFRMMLREVKGNEREFVHTYLRQRNIDEKAIEEFGIGYSLNRWDAMLNHFHETGDFSPGEIEKAGLIIRKENEKQGFYDRFRGRLMFPIHNESGKVVGFGGRKLLEEDQGGKYINSPETRIYNKSRILYGLNHAKDHIRYAESAILVEGYMDLITMFRHGIKNVVASSGTALTEEQVKLLSRYAGKVYVLFDADSAGISAAKRGTEIMLQGGLDINVVTLPAGEDPDSFLGKKGAEDFHKQLKSGMSFVSFISDMYQKEGKLSSVEGKTEFIKEVISYIAVIPDKIKRSLFLKEIAEKYSLMETDLRDELEKILRRRKQFPETSVVIPDAPSGKRQESVEFEVSVNERELLRVFLRGDPEAVAYIENNLETAFIRNSRILRIVEHLLDDCVNHERIELSRILQGLNGDDECVGIIMEAVADKHEASYFEYSTFDSLLENEIRPVYDIDHAKDVIRSLKLEQVNKEIESLKGDPENLSRVFQLIKEASALRKGA